MFFVSLDGGDRRFKPPPLIHINIPAQSPGYS
jgi:hypothetical protein